MKLSLDALKDHVPWEEADFELPRFDPAAVRAKTLRRPVWLHLGAGNLFRALPAALMQRLLNEEAWDTGLIAAECRDGEIVERAYAPFDNLSILCVLRADGRMDKKVIASVAEALRCDGTRPRDEARLRAVLAGSSLQLVSLTITEAGYAVMDAAGRPLPIIRHDIDAPPSAAHSTLGKLTAGLWARFRQGGAPLALVSLDQLPRNGDRLRAAVLYIAEGWRESGYVGKDFIQYLLNESKIAFPISMVDKITPPPQEKIARLLEGAGFEYAAPFVTKKGTPAASFVNAEEAEYLAVEDRFPAGRPPLEKAGAYFVSREVVEKAEKIKACACLGPLLTALGVLGSLLSYSQISDAVRDKDLNALVSRMIYQETLPAATDPGIFSPGDYAREALEQRLPNPFLSDTPQRAAAHTFRKLPLRFGETLKACAAARHPDPLSLRCVPFVLAAWLRYLMGVDDNLTPFVPGPDSLPVGMREAIDALKMGRAAAEDPLAPLFRRKDIWGADLDALGLTPKITEYLNRMLKGRGAVRAALQSVLKE